MWSNKRWQFQVLCWSASKTFKTVLRERKGKEVSIRTIQQKRYHQKLDSMLKGYEYQHEHAEGSPYLQPLEESSQCKSCQHHQLQVPSFWRLPNQRYFHSWMRLTGKMAKLIHQNTLPDVVCTAVVDAEEWFASPSSSQQKDICFSYLHGNCKWLFNSLHEDGVGTEKKEAVPFNIEEEEQLWLKNMFNVENPTGLQRAIFFYVGKLFCLYEADKTWNSPSSRDSKILTITCILNMGQKIGVVVWSSYMSPKRRFLSMKTWKLVKGCSEAHWSLHIEVTNLGKWKQYFWL